MSIIPYGKQSLDEKDFESVLKALKGDFITQGPIIERFEEALRRRVGAAGAVAVANGTLALEIAYAAAGLEREKRILVPAITFLATASAAMRLGAVPLFVDVDEDTGLLSMRDLEAKLAGRSASERAAIAMVAPVHFAGEPVDLRAVRERVGETMLIVEDAAHALGAIDPEGSPIGGSTLSDAAIFSFHPVKHITTGEGGAIVSRDERVLSRARELRSHGMHKDPKRFQLGEESPFGGPFYYECEEVGWNARITDFQAALGLSQLTKLDCFLSRRRELAKRYDRALGEAPFQEKLRPLGVRNPAHHAYHLYPIRLERRSRDESLESIAERRKELFLYLADGGVRAQVHYIPLPLQPVYRRFVRDPMRDYPGAMRYFAGALSLPLYPELSDSEQDRVLDRLRRWCER